MYLQLPSLFALSHSPFHSHFHSLHLTPTHTLTLTPCHQFSRHGLKWEYLPKQSAVLLDKIYKFEHITTYELGGEAADRVLRDKGEEESQIDRNCSTYA